MVSRPEILFTTIPSFLPLFDREHEAYKKRYKVFYGGRYSAKSTQAARGLLVRGYEQPLRILCTREVQKSITDSVHKLLKDQIQELGLGAFYKVLENKVVGLNGTEFFFQGLQQHTITSIKSFEGIDICWVEEVNTVRGESWKMLIPTIRKEGSEIWVTFNPDQESDYSYSQFVMHRRDDAYVVKVNWYDLPDSWLTSAIKSEISALRETSYEEYLHVYGGECRTFSDELIIQPSALRRAFETQPIDIYDDTPKTYGLDPARLGDKIKLSCMEGRNVRWLETFPPGRIDETTARLIRKIEKEEPDKCFIDAGGLGVGVYDNCVGQGFVDVVVKVDFGGRALNPDRHYNMRAQMYELFADWLEDQPSSIMCDKATQDQLILEATSIKKVWRKNSVLDLTPKDKIKEDYGFSPDNLDSLVLNFAQRIRKASSRIDHSKQF